MVAFGGIILALCKANLKFANLVLICAGCFSASGQQKPDVIVDGGRKVFGVVEGNAIYLSNHNKSRLAVRSWMDKLGLAKKKLIKDLKRQDCTRDKCIFHKAGRTITVVVAGQAEFEYIEAEMVVNLS